MTPDVVHYYWRPGCGFCTMLRRGLQKAGIETVDHNIWDDPEAAAIVRSHAGGDETVPTVVVDDVGLVNPSTRQVVHHLEQMAPHLLPNDHISTRHGILARLFGS
jgi:glutaredoxin